MAPGFCLRCPPRCNPPSADFIEDELADAPPGAPTESSDSPLISLVPSRAPTPGLAPAPPATTPAPAPTKDLFRQFMQAYIEERRNHAPDPAPASLAEP